MRSTRAGRSQYKSIKSVGKNTEDHLTITMTRYYYNPLSDQVRGPHALSVLRAMVEAGEISASCQICMEGTEEWMPLTDTELPEHKMSSPVLNQQPQQFPQSSFRKDVEALIAKKITLRTDDRISALCFDLEKDDSGKPDVVGLFKRVVVNPAMVHIAPTILELEGSDPFPLPILIGDATMLRGLENGIVITENYIFWKNQMEPGNCLEIRELNSVQFNSGMLGPTISLNGKKFQGGMINKRTVEELASVIDFMKTKIHIYPAPRR